MKYGPLCKVSQWSGEKLVNVYLTLALQRSPKGEVAETIEKKQGNITVKHNINMQKIETNCSSLAKGKYFEPLHTESQPFL